MEDDFPFSFGNVSDQDEGSDGLFCALKTKGNGKRTKAPVDQEPYYAQIDEDGWFHRTGKSVRELMLHDKNGATKVKMQADHCYMLHKYQDAYDIAQEYCYIIARNDLGAATESREVQSPKTCADKTGVLKVTDSKEMQEMALRCAVKLGKFVEAEALADDLTLQDIGTLFLKARVYMAVGRYNDAALMLVQYQKTRSSNYAIWRTLAECLHESAATASVESGSAPETASKLSSISPRKPRILSILALISILRARHLMRVSNWSSVDYAQARFKKEMNVLEQQLHALEQACDLQTDRTADRTLGGEKWNSVELEMQSRVQEYERMVVMPAQELLQKMKANGGQQLDSSEGIFTFEVIEFIVGSWDPQVLASALSSGTTAEEEGELLEVSVRNK